MSRLLFFCSLLLLMVSCECQENLYPACPEFEINQSCIVGQDGLTKVISESTDLNFIVHTTCKLGKTQCLYGKTVCVASVGPTDEICDGLDNDCDFEVDEDFDNDFDGRTVCGGDCDDTDSAINSSMIEICDGKDNDCNGQVDDLLAIECWDGSPDTEKNSDNVPCKTGTSQCKNGLWTACTNQVLPTKEICDGEDNDCNGLIDDSVFTDGLQCGPATDTGACSYGGEICLFGESFCAAPLPVLEQNEICDNQDNDCDGFVDEELWRECRTECGRGYEFCSSGIWIGCSAGVPKTEICDGLDNNCDGEVDEGCSCANGQIKLCYQDVVDTQGSLLDCGVGLSTCTLNTWGPCIFLSTEPEQCDGFDNDCDGTKDEFYLQCGNAVTAGIGQCVLGETYCANGSFSECLGAVDPEEEVCDNQDNDCDGEIDNDLVRNEKVDMVFAVDVSASMGNSIQALIQGMSNYVNSFQNTEHMFGLVTFPVAQSGGLNVIDEMLVVTNPHLTTASDFVASLQSIGISNLSIEPSLDVMMNLASPNDPLQINWRPDATPYIIMISDEAAYSSLGNTETSVWLQASNCQIGNCASGDRIEIFVITNMNLYSTFDMTVYGDYNRLFNIYPANEIRYTEILKEIFTNVCIDTSEIDGGVINGG